MELVLPDTPEGKAMAQALLLNGLATTVESNCSPQLASVDERMKHALLCLEREGKLKHKYDYVWIMLFINEEHEPKTGLFFESINSFIEYIRNYLGCPRIAGVSTLSQYYSCCKGRYPNWSFSDTKDATERLRRTNIATRFSSIFVKGK